MDGAHARTPHPSHPRTRLALERVDVLGVEAPQEALGLQQAEEEVGARGEESARVQLARQVEEGARVAAEELQDRKQVDDRVWRVGGSRTS